MQIKKILIIRFRRVGDAILSSSLCSSLRKSFPNAQIHYVLNENIAPLFDHHPDIDRVITFSESEMKTVAIYRAKVKSIMQEGNYDVIIDTRSTLKTLLFALYSLKTKYRIGRKKAYNIGLHNYRIDTYFDGQRDTVDLTLDLLNPLAKKYKIFKDPNFRLCVTNHEKASFAQYMQAKGIDFAKPVVVCAVATRVETKAWAKYKMADVLRRILQKYPNVQLIFNYAGERELKVATELYEDLDKDPRIFINIEAKNLRELPAMLANASFYVGNEGGPRHMMQALGGASFAIYPPNVPKKEWLPNQSETTQGIELADIYPKASVDDSLTFEQKMGLINVESVWNALDKMLEKQL